MVALGFATAFTHVRNPAIIYELDACPSPPVGEGGRRSLTDEGSRWPCHALGASAPFKMTANPRERTRTVPGHSKRPAFRSLLACFRVGSRLRIGPPAACTQVGNLSATPHPSRSRGPPSPARGEGKMRRFVNWVGAAPRWRRGSRLRVSDMCECRSSASPGERRHAAYAANPLTTSSTAWP